jgi:mono/diheme cytochrome c family protein
VRSGLAPAHRVRPLRFYMTLACASCWCVLAGCDNSQNPAYPPELRYPQREDLLVIKQPKNTILFPFAEPPGHLEETIAKANGQEDAVVKDPKSIAQKERDELRKYLDATFGTPARPTVHPDDDDSKPIVEALKLDDAELAAGSKVYRRHCLQCHGVAGDGRGPSGPWLHPHPRDYRQGLFKFISSQGGNERKPRRDDLHRTLTVGIEGTSMPSFALLTESEREALISYVIHLSIRGEVEYRVAVAAAQKTLQNDVKSDAEMWTVNILKYWNASNKNVIAPQKDTPALNGSQRLESVRRGYQAFTDSKSGNCVSCHFDFGRQAQFRYDAWGTLTRPNNLTAGVYRGGRRPIDIFWRVRGGINPCEMPKDDKDDDDKVWDIVNFVHALPYPKMLPEDVREKVYPEHHGSEHRVAER